MIINMNGAKAPETPSPVLQEKTVTPETLPVVIGADEGYDGLSQVTVNPDAQLKAENIRSGKTVFGVTGVFEGVNTGDALTPEELINITGVGTSLTGFVIRNLDVDAELTFVKDEVTDSANDYLQYGGVGTPQAGVTICGLGKPQSLKLSYSCVYYPVSTYKSYAKLDQSYSTSGKVTGSLFDKEYTGSPIYYSSMLTSLLVTAEMTEYGIYEADVHIEGYVTITLGYHSSVAFISDSEYPKKVNTDIHVKYSKQNNSADTGILDITGLPVFTVENYPVGYKYGNNDSYVLQLIVEKAWLLTIPVKTG